MILTLAISPAVDLTYRANDLNLGASHRVPPALKMAGGKGLNVARVLSQFTQDVITVAPLGGASGSWVAAELASKGIALEPVAIAGETRSCIAVISGEVGKEKATLLNEEPPALLTIEWEKLAEQVAKHLTAASCLVVSGTVPSAVPPARFGSLLRAAQLRAPVIADTQGDFLLASAEAGSYLVCPNSSEARAATRTTTDSDAAQALLGIGARNVLITQGKKGAVLVTRRDIYKICGPILSGNPTGAGDAFVAGIAYQTSLGAEIVESVVFGSAVALSSLGCPTAGEIDVTAREGFSAQVSVKLLRKN